MHSTFTFICFGGLKWAWRGYMEVLSEMTKEFGLMCGPKIDTKRIKLNGNEFRQNKKKINSKWCQTSKWPLYFFCCFVAFLFVFCADLLPLSTPESFWSYNENCCNDKFPIDFLSVSCLFFQCILENFQVSLMFKRAKLKQ